MHQTTKLLTTTLFDEGSGGITGSDLPTILLLVECGTAGRRIQRNVRVQLYRSNMEELHVYTSTVSALTHLTNERAACISIEDAD